MTDEAMIPNMRRRSSQKKANNVSTVKILLVVCGFLILIASPFFNFEIKHFIIPTDLFTNKELTFQNFVYTTYFIPQIPFLLFICSVLGKKLSLTCTILYLIAGIFFVPVFALGGGLKYVAQYGFGYLLAFIPAANYVATALEQDSKALNSLKAVIVGVLTIHLCGILYMIIIALIRHSGWATISNWLISQSGLKILYDIIFAYTLVMIGNIIREWLTFTTK